MTEIVPVGSSSVQLSMANRGPLRRSTATGPSQFVVSQSHSFPTPLSTNAQGPDAGMAANMLDTTEGPVEDPAPIPISCSAVPSSAASTVSDDALPAFTS